MKKIIILTIGLSSLAFFSTAQSTDSIPNSGFEDWIWVGWFANPDGWITNNSQLLANTVFVDTNSYSGNYAMMLINSGALRPYAACGFQVIHHPLALYGYLRNQLLNNDSAIILIRLFQNNIQIDSGFQIVYGGFNPNYSGFSVPVTQNSTGADSCVIEFFGGTVYQSSVSYDDLFFTFPNGIFELNDPLSFSVGPNPTNDLLFIHLPVLNSHVNTVASLFDMTGNKLMEEKITTGNSSSCMTCGDWILKEEFLPAERQEIISLKNFPRGVYLLIIRQDNKTGTKLIIKN